jgi:hypothetical protein
MVNLFDSSPLLFLVFAGASIILAIVWIVFPFVVISRLGKIEEHLSAIRNKTDASPNEPKSEDPAP